MFRPVGTLAVAMALAGFMMVSALDALAAEESPCKADYEKLCGDVKPGGGRIMECLKEHKDELSPECKTFLENKKAEIMEKVQHVQEKCKSDVDKLCSGVEPGGGRILKCLLQHKDELTEDCRNALHK